MAIYHNILSSRKYSYLIIRNGIYYFSIKVNGKIIRKSLFTDSADVARCIVERIITNPTFINASKPLILSLLTEQLFYFSQQIKQSELTSLSHLSIKKSFTKEDKPHNHNTSTDVGFCDALNLWVNDKNSTFHRKQGGGEVQEKTKAEKLTYLTNVFSLLWRNKTLKQISSSDIDRALYIYSCYPKRRILPWSKLSKEELMNAAINGKVPYCERFNQSLNRVKTSLMSFFDYFWRRNILSHNPMSELRFSVDKKYNNRGKLTSKQIKKIIRYCLSEKPSPIKSAILLQLYGGLRNKEIENLSISDIKKHRNISYIHVKGTKTMNAERYVPIHPIIIESGLIDFIQSQGQLKARQISHQFKNLMKNTFQFEPCDNRGNTISFYSLRHSFATSLAQTGASDAHIEWLMGHAHAGTKSKYITKSESIIPKLAQVISKISF